MIEVNFITHAGIGKHYYWRTPEEYLFSFSYCCGTIDYLFMLTLIMPLLLMIVSILI